MGAWPVEVGEELASMYAAGRARWPAIGPLAPEDYFAHLAMLVPPDVEPAVHLRRLVAEDLYLACACLHDVPGAVATFDAHYLARVPAIVARVDGCREVADEIQQVLRERLLVRRADGPPRIATYSGRGALMVWVRVIAIRAALDLAKQPEESRRHDDATLLEGLAAEPSPELDLLRARHAAAMSDAFRAALASLDPEHRVILRMYFAAGQNTERIAAALRVNRSTAARRLVAARQAVFDATRRRMHEQLPLAADEFASLARALHDQLDVSLSGLFREA
jgi:RNA polymerase sigma-70 factor, ECF subfamily